MTIRHRTTHVYVDENDVEFELPIVDPYGLDIDDSLIRWVGSDGRTVLSYIVTDEYSQDLNPAERDCSGWQVFDVLWSQGDADELSRRFECENCDYHYRDHLDDEGNMRTDLDTWLNCEGGWSPPPAQRALEAGRAFFFERYEHGVVIYGLQGESSQVDRQWDVTNVAGFMWADDDWDEGVDIKQAARDFLSEYTDWCNGNVYLIVHATYNDDGSLHDYDCCGGYIGYEYAERELKSEVGV